MSGNAGPEINAIGSNTTKEENTFVELEIELFR